MNENLDSAGGEIVHNHDLQRFELRVDGGLAFADYTRIGDVITFTHVFVPGALRGAGLGSRLAEAALEYARASDLTVIAKCPFVAAWIRRHPDYQPLLASSR